MMRLADLADDALYVGGGRGLAAPTNGSSPGRMAMFTEIRRADAST